MDNNNKNKKTYKEYAEKKAKKSSLIANCIKAFFTGGLICILGQLFFDFYKAMGVDEKFQSTLASVTLVFLTAIFTGIGIFDKIAKFGGAGALVPITGFANSVVSPAIDNKAEGMVLGLGAKIFIISGPVILYGTLFSIIYGIIYYVVSIL